MAGSVILLLTFLLFPRLGTAFLGRGTLLENDGDIFDLYCDGFDKGVRVWHHREITREAVRRAVVRYFKEVEPAGRTYNHRDGMTLEEAYEEYYGPAYSPKPFLDTVSKLVDAAAEVDAGLMGADPRYHFGNERFSESQVMLTGRWRRMVSAGRAGDYDTARQLLGLSLGTIQDFYSHTNWVELGNKDFNRNVGATGKDFLNVATEREHTCQDCGEGADGRGSCRNNILEDIIRQGKLTSGYIEDLWVDGTRVGKPRGVDKCSHGGPRDRSRGAGARGGINKELPTSCFSPHHYLHQRAAQQAVEATEYYLTVVRGSLGTPAFSRLLGLHPTPAIVVVLDTTESMAQELQALTRTFSRLNDKHSAADYPPSEYLFVPFNDPLYGPIVRSQHPAEIYRTLSQLRTGGGGDEAELSMSALRLALHHSPPHSHLFLFTDAPIKDQEFFETVVTLAHSKAIKVTPVITLPTRFSRFATEEDLSAYSVFGDEETEVFTYSTQELEIKEELSQITNSSEIKSTKRRPKRQVRNYSKYEELAEKTGGHVVQVERGKVDEVSRMMEVEQYPAAVLWRTLRSTVSQNVKIPIDSLVREIEVSISGGVNSATLASSSIKFDLTSQTNGGDLKGYTVVALTPFFLQIRIDITQQQQYLGDWTLTFEPKRVCSVTVSARTPLDIAPTFYLPDERSFHPSLQRIQDHPSQDLNSYLDMVITGVDRAGLREVNEARLLDRSGSEAQLVFPTSSPLRNTYLSLPTRDLPQERFTVALYGRDGSGRHFRRESGTSWERVESVISFPLGRDIWGSPGAILRIPVFITNTDSATGTSNTYFLTANDAFGSSVNLDQQRVTLGRNETATVQVTLYIDPQTLPRTTNSLVVSASSTRGDISHARAHISITPLVIDRTPPTCEVISKISCSSSDLMPSSCSNSRWSMQFTVRDNRGVFLVESQPEANFPNFASGDREVTLPYSASCCNPGVTIVVTDIDNNFVTCEVNNGELESSGGTTTLTTAAITGIAVGSVLLVLIIIAVVVIFVIYRRRTRKEDVTTRAPRRLSME
ncbi:von Willebrand factor A domain-containing protein 7-like isoform X2 [Portunus trituberculatus]|uniref:von Willebrand factor A domain-containing protein 7-like isoform X2 n=1 Tax=Portunus trituberculatus TaxID=210409 RepID=UPI001E1CEB89|nr:von Willebrand factor A domain-containing protein 7-like isoform X2 [Portunus trituberculatus]